MDGGGCITQMTPGSRDARSSQLAHLGLGMCCFQPSSSYHSCWNPARCLAPIQSSQPAWLGWQVLCPYLQIEQMRLRGMVTCLRSQGERVSGREALLLITVLHCPSKLEGPAPPRSRHTVTRELLNGRACEHIKPQRKNGQYEKMFNCSVIKEMQIKLRCHFLPINLAKTC